MGYLTQPLRDAYWALVKECLIRFYRVSESDATKRVAGFLREMENAPEEIDTDVVYNNEAFHLAGDLIGRELDIRPFWEEYVATMDRVYGTFLDSDPARDSPPGFLPAA